MKLLVETYTTDTHEILYFENSEIDIAVRAAQKAWGEVLLDHSDPDYGNMLNKALSADHQLKELTRKVLELGHSTIVEEYRRIE